MTRYLLIVMLIMVGQSARAAGLYSPSGLVLTLQNEPANRSVIDLVRPSHPGNSAAVMNYLKEVFRRIESQFENQPLLDSMGNRSCTRRIYQYVLILDKFGALVDIEDMTELDPSGLRGITHEYLMQTVRRAGPLPSFPEIEFAGNRSVGIPARFEVDCKPLWHRKLPTPEGSPMQEIIRFEPRD